MTSEARDQAGDYVWALTTSESKEKQDFGLSVMQIIMTVLSTNQL